MKQFKYIFTAIVLAFCFSISIDFISNSVAYASQTYFVPKPDFLPGPSAKPQTGAEVQEYVLNTTVPLVINIITGIFGVLAFLGIIVSVIKILTAFGSEDDIGNAKTTLKYSVFGFILIILAYAIVSIAISVALPSTALHQYLHDNSIANIFEIPSAYASATSDLLLPSQKDFIANSENKVSLPEGDLISEILPAIVVNALYAVGFLIFIGFIYGGAMLVIGQGNDEEIAQAKTIVAYSAISLAIISGAYAIIYGLTSLEFTNDPSTDADNVYTEAPIQ